MEICARQLRKELSVIKRDKSSFGLIQYGEILEKYKKIINEYQAEYDGGTDFGRDRIQQSIWNERIQRRLDSLCDYR